MGQEYASGTTSEHVRYPSGLMLRWKTNSASRMTGMSAANGQFVPTNAVQ